jgi:hypothetical protein
MSREVHRRYQTTIDQHKDTDARTGAPLRAPREVVTVFEEFARGRSWGDLPAEEQARWSGLLGEIHAARIALESLDAARRSRAKEILFRLEDGRAEDEAAVILHAIEASAAGPP